MRRARARNAAFVAVALVLGSLGLYNIFLKATWRLMDDGVFWKVAPQGLVAGRVAPGGPAALAGVRVGDVLLALGGDEAAGPEQVQQRLSRTAPGARLTYTLLRAEERAAASVRPALITIIGLLSATSRADERNDLASPMDSM